MPTQPRRRGARRRAANGLEAEIAAKIAESASRLAQSGRFNLAMTRLQSIADGRRAAMRRPLFDHSEIVDRLVRLADAPAPAKPTRDRMTWQRAVAAAEQHCRHNPFPGARALAKIIGCSISTMRKAIDHSDLLRRKVVKSQEGRAIRTTSIRPVVTDSRPDDRAVDPAEQVERRERASTDEIFNRLLEQAKPHERDKLNAMPASKRRELVAMLNPAPSPRRPRR